MKTLGIDYGSKRVGLAISDDGGSIAFPFKIIENKLKGLVQELGGSEGKSETKKILVNTKKICDLECAKCMMTMMSEKKSMKTIDLENILADETNENCMKCKKYTELSSSIKSIIDNL